ncbi:heme lyase CcmF/NrfE family subunit [Candidatus Solirubrobacter pratensis]|uniref:heme lyase CcmF/NrfE family subunit n=1 Tax=Candidatus Solirubrobacter pratensis TaxID=1298857 RepID=UPI0003FDF6F0|nr:cytochrome c-type biogenesis CcmF C-terminal domain-containing protein [Candidatus Solirubrobacter pratensis]
MRVVGQACLIVALACAVYGVLASLYGVRSGRREWVASGRRAVYAMAGSTAVAFLILEAAFERSDFGFALVAGHSSTTTPTFYRLTAMWSSQEGSLLLWLFLLGTWSSIILFATRHRLRMLAPYATAILMGFGTFFASLLVFAESPFGASNPVPTEGAGLEPLLRDPLMMIHPPMLYSGYTLFTIPFAFAAAALITRRLDAEWIRSTRPFTLGAWALLGFGIVLGARWSYHELGWGGYWAWDPVENASLMPWLTGTAFLHSVMIQERRGMLKIWNVSLVLTTGVLAILGTFLVRSGILNSIHAFGASTLGVPFLLLIGAMVALSVALVVTRAPMLRSEHRLDSLLSREAIFLLNNLVLVGLCFVVFWGTFFPLISEAVTGTQASVGPPWFDRYIVPLALVLVLLTGIGPVIAWRRASAAALRKHLLRPALAGGLLVVLLLGLGIRGSVTAFALFALAGFVGAVVAQEFATGLHARRAVAREPMPVALVSLVRRNRRRYGGYLVHLGVMILFVGVSASSSFQAIHDARLKPGQSTRVGSYTFTYVKPTSQLHAASNGRLERISLGAVLRVKRDGQAAKTISTTKDYFPSQDPSLGPVSRFFEGEATSEVGLRQGVLKDVWSAVNPDTSRLRARIAEGDKVFAKAGGALTPQQANEYLAVALQGLTAGYAKDPPPANFRLLISPLVTWIWVGAFVILFGALIAIWPTPRGVARRVSAAYAARVGREVRIPA